MHSRVLLPQHYTKRPNSIFNSILIVCVGNICRSPSAERIFKKKMPLMTIASAGLQALVGHDIDESAASLLKLNGYDASPHAACKLNRMLINQADLVFVMEKSHQTLLMKKYPQASGKILLLGKWLDDADIHDPYGKSPEAFSYVFSQIEKSCSSWCKKLIINHHD